MFILSACESAGVFALSFSAWVCFGLGVHSLFLRALSSQAVHAGECDEPASIKVWRVAVKTLSRVCLVSVRRVQQEPCLRKC